MPTDVRVPDIGESITAVKLVTWLKREGDSVKIGQPIAEVETDKASTEIESPAAGVLGQIRVPAGTDAVPIGSIIAVILDEAGQQQTAAPQTAAAERPP